MRTFLATLALVFAAAAVHADPLNCGLTQYTPAPGLTADVAGDTVAVTWDGDRDQERSGCVLRCGTPPATARSSRR